MPKWLSMAGNWFTAGGFSSNPIPVRVCAEQFSNPSNRTRVNILEQNFWDVLKFFFGISHL